MTQHAMATRVELVLTPTELEGLDPARLGGATCVVFDVLRATSTIVTALNSGAREIIAVREIAEALEVRAAHPDVLLAGERGGKRITAGQTGSVSFDLGNSPREFTPERVGNRSIVMTTTNGTRAIRGCEGASLILIASFLNLATTARVLTHSSSGHVVLVCSGTGDEASTEDTLGAGALLALLPKAQFDTSADACRMALGLHQAEGRDLERAFADSVNGRRLAADPDLRGDLTFCAQRDVVAKAVHVVGNVARFVP